MVRRLLILYLFVLPVAFWPGSTSYSALKLTLTAILAAAVGAAAAYSARGPRDAPGVELRRGWIAPSGLLLAAAGAVTLPFALNRTLAWQGVALILLWTVLATATAETVSTRRRLEQLTWALVLGAALAGVYGMLQVFGVLPGAPPKYGLPPGISTMGNQNYLAGLLAVAVFPSFLLWSAPGRGRRAAAVALSGILVLSMVVCRAVGPVLAVPGAAVPLAIALVLSRRGRVRLVPGWYALCLAATAAALAVGLSLALRVPTIGPDGVRAEPNPVRRLYNRNSGALRVTDWRVGLEMLRRHPLHGVGLNNYQVDWPASRAGLGVFRDELELSTHAPRATKAHDEFIQWAAETGIVGILALAAVVVAGFWRWRRRLLALDDPGDRRDFLLLTAGVHAAGLHALVSFPTHLPATAAALVLVLGGLDARLFDRGGEAVVRLRLRPVAVGAVLAASLVVAVVAVREFRADLLQKRALGRFLAARYETAGDDLERAVAGRFWPGTGLLYAAMSRLATGQGAGAETLLRESLDTEPTFEAMLQLAEILRDQGRFGAATRLLDELDACDPTQKFRLDSRYTRATIALRERRYDEAEAGLRGLLRDDPDYHRGWIAYGYLAALRGDDATAVELYRHAVEIIDGKLEGLRSAPVLDDLGKGPAAWQSFTGRKARLLQHRAAALKALASLGASADEATGAEPDAGSPDAGRPDGSQR